MKYGGIESYNVELLVDYTFFGSDSTYDKSVLSSGLDINLTVRNRKRSE